MEPLMYMGFRIIADSRITKSEQARRHRKKRINKKWLKRYGYKQVPDLEHFYVTIIPGQGKTLLCHPKIYDKLAYQIRRKVEG